jgi:hypothetical protein
MRRLTFLAALILILIGFWRLNKPAAPKADLPPEALASPNEELIRSRPDLSPSQAAVLLLGKSQQAFPAARVLEAAGLSFTVTRDRAAALRRRLVFIPLDDQPLRLPPSDMDSLRDYVSGGGVLVLQMPAADLWPELTGLSRAAASQSRRLIALRGPADPGWAWAERTEELELPLASAKVRKGPWSAALFPAPGQGAEILADFKDTGEPALTRRRLGGGAVYVLGAHLRDLSVRPQAGRGFDAARSSVNGYEPAADVWPLLFRAWSEQAGPFWLRLRTVPGRGRGVFLLSHDFGPGADAAQAGEFAALESSRGVKATWFFQTSVKADDPANQFFDARQRQLARDLAFAGHELGSLSVCFPPDLEALPVGEKVPDPKDYRPDVDVRGFTRQGSLLGELGVSKALLEKTLSPGSVSGFRSPFFSYPQSLDLALARAGYAYDSSLSANSVMTHLPFRLVASRAMVRETDLVELPVTFAQPRPEEPPLTAQALLATAGLISRHGGWSVWSLKPDGKPGRLELLREVLDGLPRETELMTMARAARFWLARSRARFSFAPGRGAKEWVVSLDLPAGSPALSFQASGPLASCACAEPDVRVSCSENVLVVDAPPKSRAEIRLRLR